MLKEPFRSIRNKHFRSWWLIRLSSSALGKCWITLAEWLQCQKQKQNEIQIDAISPELMSFHKSTSDTSSPPCKLWTSCKVHLLFCYYLWKAATCEKGFNSGAVVSIKIHHIYSPFFPLTGWKQCHYLLSHRAFICAGETRRGSCCCFHLEPRGPEGGKNPPVIFTALKGIQNVTHRSDGCP